MVGSGDTPKEYVRENEEQLERLIKHSNNTFVRALSLAALLEYGEDASPEALEADIERLKEMAGGDH
jgi:hypothetical protein